MKYYQVSVLQASKIYQNLWPSQDTTELDGVGQYGTEVVVIVEVYQPQL